MTKGNPPLSIPRKEPVVISHLDAKTGLLDVVLNRPDKKNAMNLEMVEALTKIVSTAKNNPSLLLDIPRNKRQPRSAKVKLMALRARGDVFCNGIDLEELADKIRLGLRTNDREGFKAYARKYIDLFYELDHLQHSEGGITFPIPIVGVIRGDAIGFGATLAALCDSTIASEEAHIGYPEKAFGCKPLISAYYALRRMGEKTAHGMFESGMPQKIEDISRFDEMIKLNTDNFSRLAELIIKDALINRGAYEFKTNARREPLALSAASNEYRDVLDMHERLLPEKMKEQLAEAFASEVLRPEVADKIEAMLARKDDEKAVVLTPQPPPKNRFSAAMEQLRRFTLTPRPRLPGNAHWAKLDVKALDRSSWFDQNHELADPDRVLIDIKYVGVSLADVYQRTGRYPRPSGEKEFVPGVEISGEVSQVGRNVKNIKVGDKVCAFTADGAYADQIALPAKQVVRLAPGIELDDGAAMVLSVSTVSHNLETRAGISRMKTDQRVLIHGGAGGTGLYAIKLAKHLGVKEIFATVGSEKNAKMVKELGATPIFYKKENFADAVIKATKGEGVDAVLDIIGAPYLSDNLRCLKDGGHLRMISFKGTDAKPGAPAGDNGNTLNGIFLGDMLSKDHGFFTKGQRVNVAAFQRLIHEHAADQPTTLRALIESHRAELSAPGKTVIIGGDRLRMLSTQEREDLATRAGTLINSRAIKPEGVYIFNMNDGGIEKAHKLIVGPHTGKILLHNRPPMQPTP